MDLSDEALIESFQQSKDSSLFRSLVRRYQNRLYSAACRILGNMEEAEEVVQETYIKVHQNLHKFRRQSSFAAWIFRISHNICVDTLRNKQRRGDLQLLAFDPLVAQEVEHYGDNFNSVVSQLSDKTNCPQQELAVNEQIEIIESSLMALPDTQRAVVVLYDIEGFSYQQIAEIVGVNQGTVRSRLHYGRAKLRQLLEPYFSSSNISSAPR